MKKQIEKAIAETSSVIDILQATSEFYKKMECVDVNDFMVLNILLEKLYNIVAIQNLIS